MAENENSIQLASLEKMKKGDRKKTLKRLYKEVRKDKRFKKAVKSGSDEPISRKAAGAAAAAAVDAVLGVKTGKPAVPPKKTALDRYTDVIGAFSKARKKYQAKQAKERKEFKYDKKTGLYVLPKIKPDKKVKMNKPYKAKKIKK